MTASTEWQLGFRVLAAGPSVAETGGVLRASTQGTKAQGRRRRDQPAHGALKEIVGEYDAIVAEAREFAAEMASNARSAIDERLGPLLPMLEALMKTRGKADWLSALEAAKVPCGPINNLAEVFADPHVRERGMVQAWEHPLAGSPVELVASPLKMSRTPVRQDLPPPLLGQHTQDVLSDVLGYSPAQQQTLRDKGVI